MRCESNDTHQNPPKKKKEKKSFPLIQGIEKNTFPLIPNHPIKSSKYKTHQMHTGGVGKFMTHDPDMLGCSAHPAGGPEKPSGKDYSLKYRLLRPVNASEPPAGAPGDQFIWCTTWGPYMPSTGDSHSSMPKGK